MISNVHRRLREATREHHERLERRADVLGRAATTAGRRALVEAFHSLHGQAEAALAPWLGDVPGLEFGARRRSVVLDRDLAAVRGRAGASCCESFEVGSRCEALGVLYVLEGSTLGGQVIRRHVLSSGGDLKGLAFLQPYGSESGARWRAFLGVLDAAARTSADEAAMIEGARAGFGLAERHLCAGAACD